MKNQKAVDSYIGSIGEIATLLEDLKGYVVDNHMDIAPEDVNWGHAGSAQHLLALLNEAALFAGIRHEK